MKYMYRRLFMLAMCLMMLANPALCEPLSSPVRTDSGLSCSTLEGEDGEALPEALGRGKWCKKVKAYNWWKGGSSVLKRGHYGYLYDIRTGIRLKIKRCGGTSHADVEPATKKDTAKLKKISGGHFSWDRRPGILYANGKYVACSFVTKPHGKQTLRNNGYNGQFCLHMLGSRTHGSNKVDSKHMACVRKAYNWAH